MLNGNDIEYRRNSFQGIALVIVLCLLVLISGITIAFFSGVCSEYATAKSAANGATARELSDATVQVVMAQIRQATSNGPSICWASQPGMIRTWGGPGNGLASSSKLGFYKLYSSGTMVVDASANEVFRPEDDIPPVAWVKQPALYTDLNAPLVGTSGTVYPIVDPRAADPVSGGTDSLVQGFSIITSGSYSAPIGDSGNRAPMPVKWIYVLRDGTMLSPDASSTGTSVTFTSGTITPSAANPIVGRVAFWTDDETCKLNLNTACGGTYWEDPVFTSDLDLAFSRYKPVLYEYNRYRGHPATTSLLPVFWSFTGLATPFESYFPFLDNTQHNTLYDIAPYLSATGTAMFGKLLQFSPRNSWGGSMMGTNPTGGFGATTGTNPVSIDADRLYASVDEAFFGFTDRGNSAGNTAINAFSDGVGNKLTNEQLKKLRFFLTTSSRAPETNPFNQPKIGIWPVPQDSGTNYRSPVDRLIAFCSTIKPDADGANGYAYYFTRKNAQSGSADWTTRNDQLFDYLDTLLHQPMPGFGRKFTDRYGENGERHILVNIYDYIRSTFNLVDTSFGFTGSGANKVYKNTFLGVASTSGAYGFGQVAPIQITKDGLPYKGFGRFPLIKEVAVLFMARAANQPPLICYGTGKPVFFYSENSNVLTEGSAALSGTVAATSYQDDQGNLTAKGLSVVLNGSAKALLNPMHPWTSGTFAKGDTVSQFKYNIGNSSTPNFVPVLVRTGTNANDPASYFPVFSSSSGNGSGTVSGAVDLVTSGTVAFISGQYPTIYGNKGDSTTRTNGYWGIAAGSSTSVVINCTDSTGSVSGTFTYVTATTSPTNDLQNLPQTHAGMPSLTVQSASTGAFDLPNPRYQSTAVASDCLPAHLPIGSTEIQAVFLADPVNISPGVIPLIPMYQLEVSGLSGFSANGASLGFPGLTVQSCLRMTPSPYYALGYQTISIGWIDTVTGKPRQSGEANQASLTFIGKPLVVSGASFGFGGGDITLNVYSPLTLGGTTNSTTVDGNTLVQAYTINFPSSGNAPFPMPLLPQTPADHAGAQTGNRLIASSEPAYNFNNDSGGFGNSAKAFYPGNSNTPAIYRFPIGTPSRIADLTPSTLLTPDPACTLAQNPNYGTGSFILPITTGSGGSGNSAALDSYAAGKSRFWYYSGNDSSILQYFLPERNGWPSANLAWKFNCDTIRAVECLYGDPRVYAGLTKVGPEFFKPHRFYSESSVRGAHTFRCTTSGFDLRNSSSNHRGATDHYLNDAYITDPKWSYNAWNYIYGTPSSNLGLKNAGANLLGRRLVDSSSYSALDLELNRMGGSSCSSSQDGSLRNQSPHTTSSSEFNKSIFRSVWGTGIKTFTEVWEKGGDFTNGVGSEPDGPYLNKPSESGGLNWAVNSQNNYYPEWWGYNGAESFSTDTQFTPNRLIASPVAFGCLPSGITPEDAWKTLLFCPNPNASTPEKYTTRMADTDVTPANQTPSGSVCPDHLLLDFFNMPVVEPYAISEPFSTAGKVNMNYQIAPFTYIRRNTALYGVFRGTMLTAVNDLFVPSMTTNEASFYKSNLLNPGYGSIVFATADDPYGKFLDQSGGWGFRYPIHAEQTLKQFQARFENSEAPDIFRSPSEICSLFLYPATQPSKGNPSNPAIPIVSWDKDNSAIKNWWYDGPANTRKGLTGDNERERPYDSIYPRLTTKSNSYTVHFRVQLLKQDTSRSANTWIENPARIVSEYRGSTLIERYIDPGDNNLVDFAKSTSSTLDEYYKFRVVHTKKFTAE